MAHVSCPDKEVATGTHGASPRTGSGSNPWNRRGQRANRRAPKGEKTQPRRASAAPGRPRQVDRLECHVGRDSVGRNEEESTEPNPSCMSSGPTLGGQESEPRARGSPGVELKAAGSRCMDEATHMNDGEDAI